MSPASQHNALPAGYRLHWYEIDSVLGQGGFGITYLAHDTNLDQPVAIKEFLPSDLATRTNDSRVQPLTDGHTDTYGWGLNRFLTEARTLAKFRHANIVRVLSVFEANGTAYMAMEYERGESLETLLKFKQLETEEALRGVLMPLLDGLEMVHEAGFIHRDIKPSNVYLREDGVPVLLDFGSARLALGVETRTLTSLVSPGYAPFEQYNATRENDKQGPWTDIYALGATMYRAVTGRGPIDAAARANMLLEGQEDPFDPCAGLARGRFSTGFFRAIDRALAFRPGDRPQSVASWRESLLAGDADADAETAVAGTPPAAVDIALDAGTERLTAPASAATPTHTATVPLTTPGAAPPEETDAGTSRGRRWLLPAGVAAIAAVALVTGMTIGSRPSPETGPVRTAGTTSGGTGATTPNATAGAAAVTDAPAAQETPPAEPAPSAEAPKLAAAARAAPAATPEATPRAERAPAPEKKAPASSPAPAPEVASAAPARSPEPASSTSRAEPAEPRAPARPLTRAEARRQRVERTLAEAEDFLAADRLTTPKRHNALFRYMTVLGMDPDNARARRGVERIVQRYFELARGATAKGDVVTATRHLRKAGWVIHEAEVRRWPSARMSALRPEHAEVKRLVAAAR